MTLFFPNTKSRTVEATLVSSGAVKLTVTGVDVKGQMFRHSAAVVMLEGCDCAFQSKSQPELDGSILIEFDYPQADPTRRVSQGRVISNHADAESGLYKVVVVLEIAQSVKVTPDQNGPQIALSEPALQPLSVSLAEVESEAEITPLELYPPSKPDIIPQTLPRPNRESAATFVFESRDFVPKTPAEDPSAIRDAVKSAVTTEIEQQVRLLKSWFSSELEKAVPATDTSNMEKMIGRAVEKQVSAKYPTSIQALNADVARQVGDRIAESEDLRTALESMAKKFFEEQSELSRTAGARIEQELGSRAATILRSFEESIAEMEVRIDGGPARIEQELSSRAATILRSFEESIAEMEVRIDGVRPNMEAALTRAQALSQEALEVMRPLREALEQLNNAEKHGVEKFQKLATAQLNMGATQFESQLNKISAERAAHFVMEMENHLIPHRQRAEETLGKLGAVLQLVQGTVRVQQERLAEQSRIAAASFEKEIRALLLRMAGSAQH